MESLTLFDLNEHIRRVVALNLPDAVWVACEIAGYNVSRGHHFFNLIQQAETTEGGIIAQANAVLWDKGYRRLRRTNGKSLLEVLQVGRAIRLKAKVQFHERYGIQLYVEDIDLSYTVGKLQLEKRQHLHQLQAAGLHLRNKQIALPIVLQKIAVLSSADAAGWLDFKNQLELNPYGYTFQLDLFSIAVQGAFVEAEMIRQLKKIKRKNYDAIVLVRGGGSNIDLHAFDRLAIAEAVAKAKFPVLVGIGHVTNESLVDVVAHTSLKTPTAVADFLIQHNLNFETRLKALQLTLQQQVQINLQREQIRLVRQQQQLTHLLELFFAAQYQRLKQQRQQLQYSQQRIIQTEHRRLAYFKSMLEQSDINTVLRKGFSITTLNGKIVKDAVQVQSGDQVLTILPNGDFQSEVKK